MNTKKCNTCLEEKSSDSFHVARKNRDGLQNTCRLCKKAVDKTYYQTSDKKHKIHIANKARALQIYKFINEYKSRLGCKHCPEKDPCCLDFHHKEKSEKLFSIGESVYVKGLETIKKEIAKCDVVCANCHRKLHYKEKQMASECAGIAR